MNEPHIILIMQSLSTINGAIYSPELLIECNEDGDAIIFESFESAKQYQDDNAIDGRVVKLPIY